MAQTPRLRPHELPPSAFLRDTDSGAHAVQLEIYRRMTPEQRLELVCQSVRDGRALTLAGLRLRHPGASEAEIDRRLKGLWLGEKLAEKVYGPLGTAVESRE